MVIGTFEKSPFYPPSVPCGMLSEFLLGSQFHFYCILLLTVTNIIEKSSTELNGDRCIWKTPLSPIFGAMWYASSIPIELTVSLLLYFIIDNDQHHKKKAPQNCMVIGAFERPPFHPSFVPGSMLPVFILSSQFHFYCILLLTVTNTMKKSSIESHAEWWISKRTFNSVYPMRWNAHSTAIELTVRYFKLIIILPVSWNNGKAPHSGEVIGEYCKGHPPEYI